MIFERDDPFKESMRGKSFFRSSIDDCEIIVLIDDWFKLGKSSDQ